MRCPRTWSFDTTVIRLEGEDIQVVCTDGDHYLGGSDWDSKIMDFLLRGFTDQNPNRLGSNNGGPREG